MKLREVNRTATIAWSPSAKHLPLLAAGTVAGALDASFSTNAELEIFDLNLNSLDGANSLRRLGSITSTSRFYRLAWGMSPEPKGARSYGFLAGGMETGELNIWDPRVIIEGGADPLVVKHSRHTGPVRGLEFNPIDPKILASGATDGEIFIWDLKNPTNNPYSPGTRSQKLEDITCLAWNRQVVYILATASNNGNTVIWDLRNRKEIITLSHPGGRKPITGIAWHPDNATRIITSADDDSSPVLLMWDLKNPLSPERVFQGHGKGTLAVSWSSKDSDLILSCGKDNRTIVWNGKDATPIGDIHVSDNWAFDAQWCSRNPDLLAVSSFDGKVSVHSIQPSPNATAAAAATAAASTGSAATNDDPFSFINSTSTPTSKFSLPQPPKWLRRPSGGSWGFGGRFVSFSFKPDQPRTVTVKTVTTEPEFAHQALELYQIAQSPNVEQYVDFCRQKSLMAEDVKKSDKDIWRFLSLMFETSAREQILQFLGFDRNDIGGNRLGPLLKKLLTNFEAGKEAPAAEGLDDVRGTAKPFNLSPSLPGEDSDIDNLVMRAMIVGDFDTAVKVCFSAKRYADGLMLAFCGGAELLKFAQDEYFAKTRDSRGYLRVLQNVLSGNLRDVAEHASLESYENAWKDVLALICTYGKTEDLSELFGLVGDRLEARKPASKFARSISDSKEHAAVLCYLGSGSMEKVVKMWLPKEEIKGLPTAGTATWTSLQAFVEKVLVFRKAVNFIDPNLTAEAESFAGDYSQLYQRLFAYAKHTADQGLLEVAWSVLEIVPEVYKLEGEKEDEINVLRDRVFRSGFVKKAVTRQPAQPFVIQEVIVPQATYQQPHYNAGHTATATAAYAGGHAANQYTSTYNNYGSYDPGRQAPVYSSTETSGYGAPAATSWSGYGNAAAAPDYSRKANVPIPPPPTPYTGGNVGSVASQSGAGNLPGFNDPPPMVGGRSSYAAKPPQTVASPFGQTNATSGYGANAAAGAGAYGSNAAAGYGGSSGGYGSSSGYGSGAGMTNGGSWNSAPAATASAPLPPPPLSGFTATPPPAVRGSSSSGARYAGNASGFGTPPPNSYGSSGADAYGGYSGQPGPISPADGGYGHAGMVRGASGAGGPPRQERTPTGGSGAAPPPPAAAAPAPAASTRYPFGDRSHISAAHMPLVNALDALLRHCKEVADPQRRREVEDAERRIATLIDQINNSEVQDDIIAKLLDLAKATQGGDFPGAHRVQVDLMTTRYGAVQAWILGIKRLIDILERASTYR
ncbi:protein transport protein S31 [Phlyctochytrium planicorne]|nr:protein transport protein S31 [Phlyctochytrium planicorne]